MTPDQRTKALAHVPPERRKRIEHRLQNLDRLSPAERKLLRERLNRFQDLSPEQKKAARAAFADLKKLPGHRRIAIRKELEQMNGLDDAGREARLNSPEFQNKFNASEQQLIENLHSAVPE